VAKRYGGGGVEVSERDFAGPFSRIFDLEAGNLGIATSINSRPLAECIAIYNSVALGTRIHPEL
jgi:hypothetical protein